MSGHRWLLELDAVRCRHGAQVVVDGLNLHLETGALAALLGPSGCGKTTVLRAIAGFQPVEGGEIRIDGRLISAPGWTLPPEQRHVGMVFQDYALFPHLRVWENVAFGLRGPTRRRRAEADRLLELVGLEAEAQRYPHELSGGQQQRVAVARALAPRPRLLLLDEPFSNLDVDLRRRLATEVRALLREQGTTALFVTHDQEEAFLMGTHVGVMRHGRLLQWDTPFNLYHEPVDRFVAEFVGEGCFIRARMLDAQTVDTPLGRVTGNRAYPWPPGTEVDMLLRPDDVLLDSTAPVQGRIVDLAFRGADTLYRLELDGGVEVQSLMPSRHEFSVGSRVGLRLEAEHLVLFPVDQGPLIGNMRRAAQSEQQAAF